MSNFEIGYCDAEEYHAGEADRVAAANLCVLGLYTVMLRIDAGDGMVAHKYPSRIMDIDEVESGIHVVSFNVSNADLAPNLDTYGTFIDGYWHKATAPGIQVGDALVKTGYFKQSYKDNDTEGELQAMLKNSQALVLRKPRNRELLVL